MDVTPLIRPGAQVIQSYAGGKFRISGNVFETAVIVTPAETLVWDAPDFEDLTPESFQRIDCDVFLLGTGRSMRFLKPDMRSALRGMGLSPDCMTTDAACRTYNVLMAEGRRVVAAMLPFV